MAAMGPGFSETAHKYWPIVSEVQISVIRPHSFCFDLESLIFRSPRGVLHCDYKCKVVLLDNFYNNFHVLGAHNFPGSLPALYFSHTGILVHSPLRRKADPGSFV